MTIMLGMLLLIPCLYSSGQVSVTPDNTPPHPSSMFEVKATDKGMLIPRMTQAQRLAIGTPANGLMVFQINGVSGFYYYSDSEWKRIGENSGLYVGKPHAGGIIFWLDETGKHGLICSMEDLSTYQEWSNVTQTAIGDSARSVWNGPRNSLAIVEQPGHTSSAAKICLDWTNPDNGSGTFSDWYLPSTGEARHLANNIYQVQKTLETDGNPTTILISNGLYWTSSEYSNISAWVFSATEDFSLSVMNIRDKSEPWHVRAVRAF